MVKIRKTFIKFLSCLIPCELVTRQLSKSIKIIFILRLEGEIFLHVTQH